MSSCTIVQTYTNFILACDTAQSWSVDGKELYRELDTKIDKIHEVGRDVVFISGFIKPVDIVTKGMYDFIDNRERIDIPRFQEFLRKEIPKENCTTMAIGMADMGVSIASIVGGKTLLTHLSQYNDYELVTNRVGLNEIYLTCVGAESNHIYNQAKKYVTDDNYRKPSTYIKLYNDVYYEGVGGFVRVYHFDSSGRRLMKEQELIEKDLKYCTHDKSKKSVYILKGKNKEDYTQVLGYNITSPHYTPNEKGMLIDVENGAIDSKNFKVFANGSARFSGDVVAANITGSSLESFGYPDGVPQKTYIDNGLITTNSIKVRPINSYTEEFSPDSSGYSLINSSQVGLTKNGVSFPFLADASGNVTLSTINNSIPITLNNKDTTGYTFRPSTHSHSEYASSSHNQSSYTIYPTLTPAGNISLYGSPNAASTTWCESTFVSVGASDFRLKKNIRNMDDIPIELFMKIKIKQFEFKCEPYGKGIVFGVLSQQLESLFLEYGLNPDEYNLFQKRKVRAYTDEGLYVDDYIHAIDYNNFIAWNMLVSQKIYQEQQEETQVNVKLLERLETLEAQVNTLKGEVK